MKKSFARFEFFASVLLCCLIVGCDSQTEKDGAEESTSENVEAGEIPAVVMDALNARFPEAEITEWSKEKEGDIVVFDFEFTQGGQKFEADINENGSIVNWEKDITADGLPESIQTVIDEKYPNSSIKEIVEVTNVKDGQDELEGYEIVLRTADNKDLEVMVAPDGRILEEEEAD